MMNERIQELYTQALENKFDYGGGRGVKPGEYYSNYKTVLNAEKFAELIVRECITKVEMRKKFATEDQHIVDHAFDLLVYDLESHFGVRE
jgi:hypothetical protein